MHPGPFAKYRHCNVGGPGLFPRRFGPYRDGTHAHRAWKRRLVQPIFFEALAWGHPRRLQTELAVRASRTAVYYGAGADAPPRDARGGCRPRTMQRVAPSVNPAEPFRRPPRAAYRGRIHALNNIAGPERYAFSLGSCTSVVHAPSLPRTFPSCHHGFGSPKGVHYGCSASWMQLRQSG